MESVSLQLAKLIKKLGVTQVFTVTGGGAMFSLLNGVMVIVRIIKYTGART